VAGDGFAEGVDGVSARIEREYRSEDERKGNDPEDNDAAAEGDGGLVDFSFAGLIDEVFGDGPAADERGGDQGEGEGDEGEE
jgi:hypothetical protein